MSYGQRGNMRSNSRIQWKEAKKETKLGCQMVRESKHVKPADNPFFYMPQFGAGTPGMGVQSSWAEVLNYRSCSV